MLSKKIKLSLNYNQQMIINTLSNEHRLLYNHLLEFSKTSIDFKKLNQCYKNYRLDNKLTISAKSAQNTCISLINNIKSYLTLKKKDNTARFPYRFKSHKYFTNFTFDSNNMKGGFKILHNKLIINLLSPSKDSNKLIINLPEYVSDINLFNIKTITFSKDDLNNNYYISFVYSENKKLYNLNSNKYLSIDLGYSTLVNGITKNENIKINNFRQKILDNKIKEVQSKRDKKQKKSNRYKKLSKTYNKLMRKKSNKLVDFQHKTSKKIIDYCIDNEIGKIIIGDLKVKSVINSDNKKINGESKLTSIGRFKTFLEYKSKNVGIEYKLINEYNTSKINCLTGTIDFDSNLNNRKFIFNNIKIDRDINSCINILTKSGVWLTQDDKIHLLNNIIINL